MITSRPTEEDIFQIAWEIPAATARRAYLEQACGGDEPLRDRVLALLQVAEEEQSFLESPPAGCIDTTDRSPITEKPGDTIGPYKLMEQIGEGGFGLVFVAEQHAPVRRKVALKVIKPGMDTKQVVARFEAERQALALMDHPNIARVIDGGTTDSGRPFFVMDLVRGLPLTDYCDQARLPIPDRLALFVQVCLDGLSLLFRAAAIPVSIEGFEDQLQLGDLFVSVRIAGLQISDFVFQNIGARSLCGHRHDHGFQRINVIRKLEIGWCHALGHIPINHFRLLVCCDSLPRLRGGGHGAL